MDSFKPFNFIASLLKPFAANFAVKFFAEKYVLPVYDRSNNKYLYDTSVGQTWMSIGHDLEVSLQISNTFCKDLSRIAIRNNSIEEIDEVEIILQAKDYFDGNIEYGSSPRNKIEPQEDLTFFELSGTGSNSSYPTKILQHIPLLEVWLENGSFKFSYEHLSIKLRSITKQGIKKRINYESDYISSIRGKLLTDITRGNWEKRAENYYHLGLLNEAKYDLYKKIHRRFNSPPIFVRMEEYLRINPIIRAYYNLSSSIDDVICRTVRQEKVLAAIFWFLVMRGYTVTDDGHLISPLDKLWID
jgi:hypothetical protein